MEARLLLVLAVVLALLLFSVKAETRVDHSASDEIGEYDDELDGDDLNAALELKISQFKEKEQQLLEKLQSLEKAKKKMEKERNQKTHNDPLKDIARFFEQNDPLEAVLGIVQGNSKKKNEKDDPFLKNIFQPKETSEHGLLKYIEETLQKIPKPDTIQSFGDNLLQNLSKVPLSVVLAVLTDSSNFKGKSIKEMGYVSDIAAILKGPLELLRTVLTTVRDTLSTIQSIPIVGGILIPFGIVELLDVVLLVLQLVILSLDQVPNIPWLP